VKLVGVEQTQVFELDVRLTVELGLVIENTEPHKHAFVVIQIVNDVRAQDIEGSTQIADFVVFAKSETP
jgi:hypothetical protein